MPKVITNYICSDGLQFDSKNDAYIHDLKIWLGNFIKTIEIAESEVNNIELKRIITEEFDSAEDLINYFTD